MSTTREETVKIVNLIHATSDDAEVLSLWYKVTSEFPMKDIVWAHGKVSVKVLKALSD